MTRLARLHWHMDQETQQGPAGRAKCSEPHVAGQVSAAAGQVFDELLVTLVMAGDRAAANRLAARWQPRLMRTARRYLGDDQMAQGAVQDAWISILRDLVRLRDPARFAPWAFGILRRRCADTLRCRIKGRSRSGDEDGEPAQAAAAPDERLAITQAFAALPPDQRLTAQLFFAEGLSLGEISEATAVPVGTVKSRLFHARCKLKAALTGDD